MTDDDAMLDPIKLAETVAQHSPIPTMELKKKLLLFATAHDKVLVPVEVEVTVCVLISLIREVLLYRDRYGFVELPDERWVIDDAPK